MIRFLTQVGLYFLFLKKVFSKPEKASVYYRQTMIEFVSLGLTSIGIISIVSFFMGAVITLQTAYNTENPIYPKYLIGLTARDTLLLEFSSTIVALILAGKFQLIGFIAELKLTVWRNHPTNFIVRLIV